LKSLRSIENSPCARKSFPITITFVGIVIGRVTPLSVKFPAIFRSSILVPVTFVFHHFWTIADPGARQMGMVDFLKNISIIGGAMMILVHGAGPYSLDSREKIG